MVLLTAVEGGGHALAQDRRWCECYPRRDQAVLSSASQCCETHGYVCDVCGLEAETGAETRRHGCLYVSDEAGLGPSISSRLGRAIRPSDYSTLVYVSSSVAVAVARMRMPRPGEWQLIDVVQFVCSPLAVRRGGRCARQLSKTLYLSRRPRARAGTASRRRVGVHDCRNESRASEQKKADQQKMLLMLASSCLDPTRPFFPGECQQISALAAGGKREERSSILG